MYVVRITPADVGARVVIRRRIPGPLPLSDVLGTLESWADGILTVRRPEGTPVRVHVDDLVAARVVPPPPVRDGPGSAPPAEVSGARPTSPAVRALGPRRAAG